MVLIEWNQKYSVNIIEIDDEHKKIINIINELHDSMLQRAAKSAMSDILKNLIDYTVFHFTKEQKYFEKYNYPHKVDHINKHKEFVDKIKDFQKGHEEDRMFLSIDVMNFLKSWLTDNIMGSDHEYTEFFNSRGLY
ncbi:MAG: bacteriohemerythrin [Spirochaetes bacterium]|nr:bacteriohemerythrin [Spirochaetota bacterium]